MWVLFIISTSASSQSGSASVQQEFTSRDKCLAAQQIMLDQTKERHNYILINTCVPK